MVLVRIANAAFEEIFHNMMEMVSGCALECPDLEAKDARPFLQQSRTAVLACSSSRQM